MVHSWSSHQTSIGILIEQSARVEPLERVTHIEQKIIFIIRTYLEKKCEEIQPKNLDLAALILQGTIKSLTHTAVIENPKLLVDGQLEREITNLWLRYLKCNLTA